MGCFNLRSLLLAVFVISNCITWTASRHHFTHNASGHRSRHRRQGAGLYLPASHVVPGGVGTGAWGEWGEVSPCSRTCGGGVASQKRICLEVAPDGRPMCTGGDTKYFSCQTQDCPAGSGDFRAEQCSAYNDVPFKGVKHTWIPYTNGPKPCELNCMPKGERFYYRHKSKVIDGTRCNDESFDVCVDGTCQPLGCDMMLGSNAREDKCRECRGNGTHCYTSKGRIDSQDLIKGYNDILLIPEGATSILIEEIKDSNNYLALRAKKDNVYYLNGDYHIDFPRTLIIAGAPWHYERSQQGFAAPDKLRCLGPTTEPLYLSLLLQDENVGIDYEYSIPNALAPPPNQQYVWVHDDFTPCSATCGGGFQTRSVTCRSREELDVVDDALCDAGLRPASNDTCNLQACAATWVPGPWSPCSKPCGQGGTRSRKVDCQKIISNGVTFSFPTTVEDQQCFELLGPKPELFQKCNTNASCPTWFTGPWKPCDQLCGEGKQTRQVVCHQRTNGRVEVLAEEECADDRPAGLQSCMLSPCEGVDWVVSEWSGCDTCLSTVKTRVAECSTKDSVLVDPKFCENHPKPELERPCDADDLPSCQVQWYATQWSTCSAECGKGVKTRRVFCGQFDAVHINVVDDSKCDNTTRYNDTTPCEIPKEKCPAKWFAGPWTECTKKCGGGEQYRKVMCLNRGKESLACPIDDTPDSVQSCNIGPCDADETLPVDAASTPVMDDEDNEDCVDEDEEEEEDEGDEVGAEVTAGELEVSMSDAPYSTTSEGSGETRLTSEFTAETGSGTGSTWPYELGSGDYTEESTEPGDTGPTTETLETVTDSTSSDLTEETSSTVSGETESEVTEASGATDATSSTDVTPTDSSGIETESDASTVSHGSTETDITEATERGATEETSETSATETSVSEGLTDNSTESTGKTETEEIGSTVKDSTVTEDTGSTVTEETVSTVSEETGSTVTEETVTTATEEASPTATEDTVTTATEEASPTATEETVTTATEEASPTATEETATTATEEASPTATEDTISTEISPSTTDSATEVTDTSTTEIVETTETSDKSSTDVTGTDTSDLSTTEGSDLSTTEGVTLSESTTESTDATGSTEITESSDSTATDETSDGGTEETTGTSDLVTTTTETEVTSSTESEGSTVSDLTSESVSTTEPSTESEPTTGSGLTSESEPTESTVSGETEFTEGTTESGSTTEFTEETSESSDTTPWDWESTVTTKKLPQCKVPRRRAKCIKTMFGCCPDKKTPAAGPFDEACPHPKTCNETRFGCCPDGVSPAEGPHAKGCPSSRCNETLYGCCKSDNSTPAEGNDQEGCPPPPPPCKSSKHGCCRDGKTEATGPLKAGCPETATEPPKPPVAEGCDAFEFGCCYDNETEASGPDGLGCPCNATEFGCCPDDVTPAGSAELEGCQKSCNTSAYGCCPDGETPAHGPGSEGCCLLYPYGCCPDNYKPADGPHLEGCGCQNARFGCCPDNVTIARGYNKEGCGCEHTEHGCCPDKHTEASGPSYEGCSCHTYQFGCCPDGTTIVKGPNLQGCACSSSPYKCCGDGQTAATGPDQAGCDCASSKYGCCPDGQTEAKGEKFSGCTDVPVNKQAACALPAVQGPCHNYSAYWFFDTQYGGCSRFWYGGCEGNGNRFATKEECEDVCVRPSDKEVCRLPKSSGGCEDTYQRWYYDPEYEQCGQFQYSGCLGNANNFETREKCQKQCQPERNEDQCKLPIERGSCAGNFARWGFNSEAGRCEQFAWGGCEGNPNRFNSEAACVLRCQPPGALQPECTLQQEAGNCTDKQPAWSFSETENRCVPFYYSGCGGNGNRFSDERSCAETCPSAFEQDVCTLPAEQGDCSNYRINWYFDIAIQRCRQFYFGGCGGNGNNFESEEQCIAGCAGAPTTTTTQRPAEGKPFEEEDCFLEKNPGPCSGNETRWAYSTEVGACQPFTYGGCQGNMNNFPSKEYCEFYCKPTQDLCQLPMRTGRCSESLPRWFYDKSTDRCSQFAYSGCDGNDNNFESAEYCERRCRASPAPTPTPTSGPTLTTTTAAALQLPAECVVSGLERCRGGRVWLRNPESGACEPYDPREREGTCEATGVFPSPEACERTCGTFIGLKWCLYPMDAGSCKGAEQKFYFDQSSNTCQQFTYGGCYGGPNRFSTIDECESVCIPETDPCKQPSEPGNCLEYHAMWYYDEARDDCNQFYWSGCGGNSNRFATQEECLGNCQRQAPVTTTSTPRPAPTALTPVVADECRTPESLTPCGVEQPAFYYNSERGACVAAMIGACRYSYTYRSEEECERSCGAFRGKDVCRTPLDPGPCSASIPKFYWDLAEGRCQQFAYGGCAGGANRFSSVDDCRQVCGHLGIDAACRLAAAAGAACAGAGAAGQGRWHHNSLYGECREFIYYGCGGNRNNFHTKQECERHCRPPPPDGNEIIPPVDCRDAEAECAAQRCQYGQLAGTDAAGCRRCQCAPAPPPDCARAQAECAALRCPSGVNRTRGSDGCESCSCNREAPRQHPCTGIQCPEGQSCVATPYRDPITQEVRYATECRLVEPVDCRDAEAECAAQRCQYGQTAATDAAGCRRCQCAPAPPPDCARAQAECAALRCPSGVNRTRGSDGCESCSCNREAPRQHPCTGIQCPEGQSCVATPYRDPITQETRYATECRLRNKPGSCPADPAVFDCSPEEVERQQQCRSDLDCRGAAKCCREGCGQRCLEPYEPTSPTAPPTPPTPPTPPPYVPEAPHAPVASPETQLSVSSQEGGVATLRCLFHSNPPPKITWQRRQITIDGSTGRYRLTSDGALEIVSLYRDDAGVYICIAENELGTAQQEIRLEVNGPVTSAAGIAGESTVTAIGELGQPLSIRCLAYGYPQPSIAWYHGQRSDMVPYDSKEYEARDNVLLIRSLDVDSLGKYVCQVYNGVTKPASLTVEVWAYARGGADERASPYLLPSGDVVVVTPRAPPPDPTLPTTQSIVEFPDVPIYTAPVRTEIRAEQTTLSAGSELNLPCEVDGHPEPDVNWSKDGVPLQSGDRIQATSARLTVSSVTVNDSGVYGCHASNGHSQHSSTVQINVQGLYIPPQCTDNPFFANCALIVRSKYCNHQYYSAFCCKSCVEAGYLNPHALKLQADQSWMKKKK